MKLTLVSIYSNGKRLERFVECEYVNGRAIVEWAVIHDMLDEMGVKDGETITIGG